MVLVAAWPQSPAGVQWFATCVVSATRLLPRVMLFSSYARATPMPSGLSPQPVVRWRCVVDGGQPAEPDVW